MKCAGYVMAIIAAACVISGGQASAAPLPVSYGNSEMVRVATTDWNGAVPGANDYSCTPSVEHPKPVVLVNSSLLSDAVNWTAVAPYLKNQGYCVFTFNYGREIYDVPPGITGLDPMDSSAAELEAEVAKVRAATGASHVDLVAHSQGGFVARYYLNRLGGASEVERMVLLSSPYTMTGSPVDFAALARETVPRELFDAILRNGTIPPVGLNVLDPWVAGAAEEFQPNIQYTEITNVTDELAFFGGMGVPAGAKNATTTFINSVRPTDLSMHFAQPYSPTAVALIGNALDPSNPVPVPCSVVPLYSFG